MRITKGKIIKALRDEPNLVIGEWVRHGELPIKGNCQVCAVGAVLRHGFNMTNSEIEGVIYGSDIEGRVCSPTSRRSVITKKAREVLAEGAWMTALSTVFETYQSSRAARLAAIAFVRKYFPTSVEIPDSKLRSLRRDMNRAVVLGYLTLSEVRRAEINSGKAPTRAEVTKARKVAVQVLTDASAESR